MDASNPKTELGPQLSACLQDAELIQYTENFRSNDISFEMLSSLTDSDLVAIGISSLGHRKRLLAQFAEMRTSSEPAEQAQVSGGSAHVTVLELTDAATRALEQSGRSVFRIQPRQDGTLHVLDSTNEAQPDQVQLKVGAFSFGTTLDVVELLRTRILDYDTAYRFRLRLKCANCGARMNEGASLCGECWTKGTGIPVPYTPPVLHSLGRPTAQPSVSNTVDRPSSIYTDQSYQVVVPGGGKRGPVSMAELKQLARNDWLNPETIVTNTSTSQQVLARDLPGLFDRKSRIAAALLSFFLGEFGADRFYVGHVRLGLIKLLSFLLSIVLFLQSVKVGPRWISVDRDLVTFATTLMIAWGAWWFVDFVRFIAGGIRRNGDGQPIAWE